MLSPIYRDIRIYRAIMFMLYGGTYSSRYKLITDCIRMEKPARVLELCFGDTLLAKYCRENGIDWLGIDRNEYFLNYARVRGYHVLKGDLSEPEKLPPADMIVISGALYHFHDKIGVLFNKIANSADRILISEHVISIDTTRGIVGWLGGILSNAGSRNESFRYSKVSLKEVICKACAEYGFQHRFVGNYKWDDVYLLCKNIIY